MTDALEADWSKMTVPQALGMTVGIASNCWSNIDNAGEFDTERARVLLDKIEARVQDAVEDAQAVRTEPAEEDNPNEPIYEDAEPAETTLVYADDEVIQVVHNGIVFQRACNKDVVADIDFNITTYCCKQWGHKAEHMDMEGYSRR